MRVGEEMNCRECPVIQYCGFHSSLDKDSGMLCNYYGAGTDFEKIEADCASGTYDHALQHSKERAPMFVGMCLKTVKGKRNLVTFKALGRLTAKRYCEVHKLEFIGEYRITLDNLEYVLV